MSPAASLLVLAAIGPPPIDLDLADDLVLETLDDAEALADSARAQDAEGPQVIYSNFSDGTTTLTKGPDNAEKNSSQICGADPYPASTADETRKKTVQNQLARMFEDFNVVLALKRPIDPPYSMIMIGPSGNGCNIKAGGIAPLDCGNKNRSNICFDFTPAGSAVVAGQEIGHTFGLLHVDTACDVMGAGYSKKGCPGGSWGYPDTDGKILGGGGCNMGSTQNSHAYLLKVLGAWPGGVRPDPTGDGRRCVNNGGPEIKILDPVDGDAVANDFVLRAEIVDDCGPVKEATLEFRGGADPPVAATPGTPFEWKLEHLPSKEATWLTITAIDLDGSWTKRELVLRVGNPSVSPSGDCGCRIAASQRTPAHALPSAAALMASIIRTRRRSRRWQREAWEAFLRRRR